MMMNGRSIEELEAELARQDEELERVSAAFVEASAGHRFEVPPSFFEELGELASPRPVTAPTFVLGLRA
jgi:hypothetical protein